MSNTDTPTPEQIAFATHPEGAFVHACPGAGKTRTIIARLSELAGSLPPRRGIAVLSFTNSTVDEFSARCRVASVDSLLKFPSYIGTLDAFVRYFIVLPASNTTSSVRPIILDSWDTLGVEIRLSGKSAFSGDPVSLDLFDPQTGFIEPNKISHSGLRNHVIKHKARYEQVASFRRQSLLTAGYLSSSEARIQTLQIIRDPSKGAALGRALSARFQEIMVDEGQDCNPLDLELLYWLRENGANLSFVCDPDQAIYEFRNGSTAAIHKLRATYAVESRLVLTGNFRSSPPICQLGATLKSAKNVDESIGNSANLRHPVLLLTYRSQNRESEIGKAFLEHLTNIELSSKNVIVLAHKEKVAQRAACGAVPTSANGRSKIESMARHLSQFWSPVATLRSKENAVQAIEVLLLDFMGLRQSNEHPTRTAERVGLDLRTHRRNALHLLMNIPKTCEDSDDGRDNWISRVRAEAKLLNLQLPLGSTVGKYFRKPPNKRWASHLQLSSVEHALKWSNIHAVKGHEYDAVCLVIPSNRAPYNRTDTLFESWEKRVDTEAKRVLYVGITRARCFATIAIPEAFADRCATLLNRGGVSFLRKDL